MTAETVVTTDVAYTESEELLGAVCEMANMIRLDPTSEKGSWLMGLVNESNDIPAGEWNASEEEVERMNAFLTEAASQLGLVEA
jgi:hypothetical protein